MTLSNSNLSNLKQTLIGELQVLIGKQRSALISKKGGTTQQKAKKKSKELTIEEEFLILQQLAELEV